MAVHNEIGSKGECLAEEYLNNIGYDTICRNWRCSKGEIDLIVSDNQSIVFVEVKTRSSDCWGNPETAVSASKIKRIVDAADLFITESDIDLDIRFDIISIIMRRDKSQIYHIEDAFLAPIN